MPFYRYACESCGETFRELHLNGDTAPVVCPVCGGRETRRLLPRIGVLYKGSGYYTTDYRKKRSTTSDKGDAKAKDSAD